MSDALHAVERLEGECRVAVVFAEASAREAIPSCAVPLELFYSSVCAAARERLLQDKFNGLITRQYLREERMLEYTMHALCTLLRDEDTLRDRIIVDERTHAASLDRYAGTLELLAIAGTQGSLVEIEEEEHRARDVLQEEALQRCFEGFANEAAVSVELALVRQHARETREAGECADLADAESIKRWTHISEAESDERLDIERLFLKDWRELFQKLVWRVVNREYDGRVEIEREEGALFEIVEAQAAAALKALPPAPRVSVWPAQQTANDAAAASPPEDVPKALSQAPAQPSVESQPISSSPAAPLAAQADDEAASSEPPPSSAPNKFAPPSRQVAASAPKQQPVFRKSDVTAVAQAWAALDAAWGDDEAV